MSIHTLSQVNHKELIYQASETKLRIYLKTIYNHRRAGQSKNYVICSIVSNNGMLWDAIVN